MPTIRICLTALLILTAAPLASAQTSTGDNHQVRNVVVGAAGGFAGGLLLREALCTSRFGYASGPCSGLEAPLIGGMIGAGLMLALTTAGPHRTRVVPAVTAPLPAVEVAARSVIGKRVWVTRVDGTEVDGDAVRVESNSLELSTSAGTQQVALAEIRRLETTGRHLRAVILGSALGAGAGTTLGAMRAVASDGTHGDDVFLGGFGGAAAGGLAGYALSGGRTTVFSMATPSVTTSYSFSVGRGAAVLGVQLRW